MSDDRVVFLAFKNPQLQPDMMTFICCAHCRNKTYTFTEDRVDGPPLVRCAACGKHLGRIGWVPND